MKDGRKIPALGFGTWNLSGEECQRMVEKALDLGYTHIDTAEGYNNESQIGEVLQTYDRSNLFITSKVSPSNLHYEDVLSSCESSLEKLGTSYLDLYLIHWPNEAISIRESLWAMKKLQEEALVRSVGISNFGVNQLKIAMGVSEAPICINQVEFHPWLYKRELLDFCKENGVILTASAPLARSRILKDELIQKTARKYDKTPAQIALKWELQKGLVTIPKTTSEDHLRKNFQLFDWKLDPQDVEKIDSIPKTERCYEFNFKAEWAI
ncbi:oxidoreductase [candidate division MSBL1 archaeon SCGC-AAA259D18]|uniref:Oxidoreductase n=1 Tax=candidate division MSBL1 archaeon SCGC-AAA259D18 TaxID=1698262 RepID=A0A133UAL5_9EURY|nr:oxidoreductase [candidate division MSBL1 archaeon SCGC-AAA259D18]